MLFGTFIVSCGTTHLMDVWTLWHPSYWLSGLIKVITACISLYTAVALVPIIPKALALPSPAQLEAANRELKLALEELATTQAQLIQSEKMSSLGQLVAGIAHEINNPVNFINGNITPANEHIQYLINFISLYQKYYPEPIPEIQALAQEIELDFIKDDLSKILSSIKMGTERVRQIIVSLRNFSRLDEAEIKSVDIHEGIDSTLLILQSRLKDKPERPAIEVIKEYGTLPKVECYPCQLNQVIMNLLTNAIDAIEISGNYQQGKITISTDVIDNKQVKIQITDNGCGMTEKVKQKIFDPFFTTKPVGSGTGLGLSISYQIINKHGGKLKCISQPHHGTEFFIQIPINMNMNNKSTLKESPLTFRFAT